LFGENAGGAQPPVNEKPIEERETLDLEDLEDIENLDLDNMEDMDLELEDIS
jgi:hypothetical protein